jgi:hypothetical protein
MNGSPRVEGVFRRVGECAMRTIAGETILVPIRSGIANLEYVYTVAVPCYRLPFTPDETAVATVRRVLGGLG